MTIDLILKDIVTEILFPNYLISCNITSDKDEEKKEKYVQKLRDILNKKKYLNELNFDIDEW